MYGAGVDLWTGTRHEYILDTLVAPRSGKGIDHNGLLLDHPESHAHHLAMKPTPPWTVICKNLRGMGRAFANFGVEAQSLFEGVPRLALNAFKVLTVENLRISLFV